MSGATEQEKWKEYLNAFVTALNDRSATALNEHHPREGSTGAWDVVVFVKDGTRYRAHIHAGSQSSRGYPKLPGNINIYTDDDTEKKCTIFIDGRAKGTDALTEEQNGRLSIMIQKTKPSVNRITKMISKKKRTRTKRGRRTRKQWATIGRGARKFKEYSPKLYKPDTVPNSFEEWLKDIDTTEDNLALGYATSGVKNDIKAFINAYKGKKLDSKLANKLKLGDNFFSAFVDEQFGDTYDDYYFDDDYYYYDDYDSVDSIDSDDSSFPVFGISDNINGHHHHHTADSYNYGHHMHSAADYVTSDYYQSNDGVILLEYSILMVGLLFVTCLVCSCIFGAGFIIGRYIYYGVRNNKRFRDVNENNEELSV